MVDFLQAKQKTVSRKSRKIGFRMKEIIISWTEGWLSLQGSYSLNLKRMTIRTILFICAIMLFSCKNSENKDNQMQSDSLKTESNGKVESEYTCPMHPQVITKSPGKCPECGMELQIRSWNFNEEWKMKKRMWVSRIEFHIL